MKPLTLEGESLILRPLLESEAPRVCEWRNDPEISRFFHRKHIEPPDYVEWMREVEADPDRGLYAIVQKTDSKLLGTIAFNIRRGKEPLSATLGIMIGDPGARGKGHGEAALELLTAGLASRFGVKKVVVEVLPDNTAAISFYEKLGYKTEMLTMSKKIAD